MWVNNLVTDSGVIYGGTGGLSTFWDADNNQPYFYNDTSGDYSGEITIAFSAFSKEGNLPGDQNVVPALGKCYFNSGDITIPLGAAYRLLEDGDAISCMVYFCRVGLTTDSMIYKFLRYTSPTDGLTYVLTYGECQVTPPTVEM